MADNEFANMLLAEIRQYHERVKRAREAVYFEPLQDLDLLSTTAPHRFRVINGGRADRAACVAFKR
jgi:hypothetical protein